MAEDKKARGMAAAALGGIGQLSSSIEDTLPKRYTAAEDGKALIIGGEDHEAQPMTLPQGTVVIDPTLSIVGQAADAKAVGDALDEDFEELNAEIQAEKRPDLLLAETAKKVKNHQTPKTLTIALMSDTHFSVDDRNANDKLSTARLMSAAPTVYHADLIGNLGDLIQGKNTVSVEKSNLINLISATKRENPNYMVILRGNHDDNGWFSQGGFGGAYGKNDMLDDNQQYQYIDSADEGIIVDDANPVGGYGYIDHEASKTRIFMLNTSDIPYVYENGRYLYTTYGWAAFSSAQIEFVADKLLFADKERPNDWAALFLMHIPMDTTNQDGYRFGIRDALIRGVVPMLGVITAYKNGTEYSYHGSTFNSATGDREQDFRVDVDADYRDKGVGDVIGFVSGHTHADNYSNRVGIERSLSRGYSFLSLMGSTSFANLIVNRAESSIAVVKHGASVPDTTDGATVIAPDEGTIESGEWKIYYDQFRPVAENIFQGWDSAGAGHSYDAADVRIDLNTMELASRVEDNRYICSKAVPITPLAQYKIPDGFNGIVIAFNSSGDRSGYISPQNSDGYKTVTSTVETQYFFVFIAHMSTFPNYNDMTVVPVI